MPRVSKQAATHVERHGPAEDRHDEIEGYMINFVSLQEDADLAAMLVGLPGDRCPCPHWGYVFKGQLTIHYEGGDEVLTAGDAFYLPPGHVPAAVAGTEFVQFSPAEQLREVEAVIVANMQRLQAGAG